MVANLGPLRPLHRSISLFDDIHLRYVRHIIHIKWQDKIPNTQVLNPCNMYGVEAMGAKAQLRDGLVTLWAHQITKFQLTFYSELQLGSKLRGWPKKRYKDCFKANLTNVAIHSRSREVVSTDRTIWQQMCFEGVRHRFEETHIERLGVTQHLQSQSQITKRKLKQEKPLNSPS